MKLHIECKKNLSKQVYGKVFQKYESGEQNLCRRLCFLQSTVRSMIKMKNMFLGYNLDYSRTFSKDVRRLTWSRSLNA